MLECQKSLAMESIFQALNSDRFSPRTGWWISLVCVECVFDAPNQRALCEGAVTTYRMGDEIVAMEFKLEGGWIDRRYLQPNTVEYLQRNQGCFFVKDDLKNVDRELTKVFNLGDGKHHRQLIAAAKDYWSSRLPGVLYGHCTGDDRFQLLGRYAAWRDATSGVALQPGNDDASIDFLGWSQSSNTLVTADYVVSQIEDIARRKGSRDAGRKLMVDCINQQFPAALVEGQMQALALLCLKEVIETGGMSGRLLAPSSISIYLGTTFVPWVAELIHLGMESEPDAYIESYTSIIGSHPSSTQGRAKALIDILHTRLVLRGAPLIRSTGMVQLQPVPRAQVVWPHEAELALEYVSRATSDPRLAAQARLVIILGLEIPLRTSEYFQLRLVDVCPKGIASLVVFPRRMDGRHKSPYNRLHADISCPALCHELLGYKAKRNAEEFLPHEDAAPELFYFGAPGYLDSAYAEGETIELVNRALRWATGDAQVSVYSLRHTAISARALACLITEASNDEMAWEAMSKQCGHGNSNSTNVYVHQVEAPLKRAIARYVHADFVQHLHQGAPVPDLKTLFEPTQRVTVELVPPIAPKKLQELSAEQFLNLMDELATGAETPVVIAKFGIEEVAISQLFELVKQRWTGPVIRLFTQRDARVAILAWGVRARHAQQPKYEKFRRYLQKTSVDPHATRFLASALNGCCREVDISLESGYWSDALLQSLSKAGYGKHEIVLFAEKRGALPDGYSSHGTWIEQTFRRGRPAFRLGLVDCNTCTPATASGAAYSATGLSWLARTLSLWLAARGEM